jgi:hypothetical protein
MTQADARYEVYRDRLRISGFRGYNPLDAGKIMGQLSPSDSLTSDRRSDRVSILPQSGDNDSKTEEDKDMAEMSKAERERQAVQAALQNGDLKDRDTYTAKQVASRCGTDSKTMRKFFRSNNSTVEPVGQGGRYEFDSADLPKIQKEFKAWRNKSGHTSTPTKAENPPPTKTQSRVRQGQPTKKQPAPQQTTSGRPKCRKCNATFSDLRTYQAHLPCDPDLLKTPRVCDFCTLSFDRRSTFAAHVCIGEDDPEPTEEELAAIDAIRSDPLKRKAFEDGENLDELDLKDI